MHEADLIAYLDSLVPMQLGMEKNILYLEALKLQGQTKNSPGHGGLLREDSPERE